MAISGHQWSVPFPRPEIIGAYLLEGSAPRPDIIGPYLLKDSAPRIYHVFLRHSASHQQVFTKYCKKTLEFERASRSLQFESVKLSHIVI